MCYVRSENNIQDSEDVKGVKVSTGGGREVYSDSTR